jgi:hypothetical protein
MRAIAFVDGQRSKKNRPGRRGDSRIRWWNPRKSNAVLAPGEAPASILTRAALLAFARQGPFLRSSPLCRNAENVLLEGPLSRSGYLIRPEESRSGRG